MCVLYIKIMAGTWKRDFHQMALYRFMSTKVKVLVVLRHSKVCKLLVLLEHVRLGVLAEEGSKVQVCGHKLLLHILQCPLVFHYLQRLPLTLR